MGENAKRNAALEALKFVQRRKTVGLGTGSTAAEFIRALAEKNKNESLELVCVATSVSSQKLAEELGLSVVGLENVGRIDLAVDGADQVDKNKNLLKGLGGALAREKVVDYAARKFVVVADESKIVEELGGVVPVEVIPFARASVERKLARMGAEVSARKKADGSEFVTDNGNEILDARFQTIKNPRALERKIKRIPGVVESGIFTGKVWKVIVGNDEGVRVL
ncbi:MAG: ribose-5-phosphate isomerase RpiA [Candidatus Micrarchaeota archaeon]